MHRLPHGSQRGHQPVPPDAVARLAGVQAVDDARITARTPSNTLSATGDSGAWELLMPTLSTKKSGARAGGAQLAQATLRLRQDAVHQVLRAATTPH